MYKLSNKPTFAALSAGMLLVACAQQSGSDQSGQMGVEPTVESAAPSVRLAPPITTVKPGASVTFSHADVKTLNVGENGSVVITVNEGYPSGILHLEATSQPGVAVFGAGASARMEMADVTTHEWRVDFQGEADGVHYLSIMAMVELEDGSIESRAYSVRVKVGDWQSAKAALDAAKTMDMLESGEAAIILEAEEAIEQATP